MPMSATVHSTRVPARMDTISPFLMPSATRPQAASSLSAASWFHETSCQAPFTFRRAAVRAPSSATRLRKSCATDCIPAAACISFRWLSAVAMVNSPLMRCHPLLRHFLQPVILGRIVAVARVEHVLDEATRVLGLAVVGQRIGQVDLGAPVVGMAREAILQQLDRLVDVALGPGQLEEVAGPHHFRRAVHVILVDL